jgi:effector-binding domain-containing protein
MIEKIGVKTTIKELVAHKTLSPNANEVIECARLNRELYEKGARPKDPTMILFHDSENKKGCEKEVMIPVEKKVEGVETKMIEKMKVAFILYVGTDRPVEYYYETLAKYIIENGLKPSMESCSIEAVYQPAEFGLSYGSFIDEDTPEHWKTEIMIPIKE